MPGRRPPRRQMRLESIGRRRFHGVRVMATMQRCLPAPATVSRRCPDIAADVCCRVDRNADETRREHHGGHLRVIHPRVPVRMPCHFVQHVRRPRDLDVGFVGFSLALLHDRAGIRHRGEFGQRLGRPEPRDRGHRAAEVQQQVAPLAYPIALQPAVVDVVEIVLGDVDRKGASTTSKYPVSGVAKISKRPMVWSRVQKGGRAV